MTGGPDGGSGQGSLPLGDRSGDRSGHTLRDTGGDTRDIRRRYPMQIQESIYGGRADDIYGAPLPVPSIYRNYGVSSAIVLGLGAWQVPARYTSRPVTFVPSQF